MIRKPLCGQEELTVFSHFTERETLAVILNVKICKTRPGADKLGGGKGLPCPV